MDVQQTSWLLAFFPCSVVISAITIGEGRESPGGGRQRVGAPPIPTNRMIGPFLEGGKPHTWELNMVGSIVHNSVRKERVLIPNTGEPFFDICGILSRGGSVLSPHARLATASSAPIGPQAVSCVKSGKS